MSVRRLKRVVVCYQWARSEGEDMLPSVYAARHYPGRWDRGNQSVLYAYERLATAVVEALLGGSGIMPPGRSFVTLTVPIGVRYERVERDTVAGWDADPPGTSAAYGNTWLRSRRSLLLLAPSAVLQNEYVALFNPYQGSFGRVVVSAPTPLADVVPALT